MPVWHDNSEGPTDFGNKVGHWPGGWLKGEWKCPTCGTMIGRNLRGEIPFWWVSKHKKECGGDRKTGEMVASSTVESQPSQVTQGR